MTIEKIKCELSLYWSKGKKDQKTFQKLVEKLEKDMELERNQWMNLLDNEENNTEIN